MSTEKYVKAGIIAGIVLVGFTIIITTIQVSSNYFQNLFVVPLDEDEVKKIFEESEEYQIFKKRFPDHEISFWINKYDAQFQAGAMNPETQNQLSLRLYYTNDQGLTHNVVCDAMERKSPSRYSADGVFTKSFLENTNCLDPKTKS
jgi:hypothetical protein